MRVLVTGGAGFVGSTLCDALLQRGDEVVVIDNFNDYYSPARKRANVAALGPQSAFTLYEADFTDAETVDRIVGKHKPHVIAHIGAMGSVRYSVQHPHLYVETNVTGTLNMLEAARKYDVGNFVFASTSSVYGQTEKIPFEETDPTDRPLAPYPATKKAAEVLGHAYHNMHGLNFTALRFFNVYGPKGRPDMMPYIVLDRIVRRDQITLFDNGQMRRDWTYIDDIIQGVMAAVDMPQPYEIVNLGCGEPVWMSEFMEIAQRIAGQEAIVTVVPAPDSEPKVTYANIDKARRLYGYDPRTSLEDGLGRFWEWYQREVGH